MAGSAEITKRGTGERYRPDKGGYLSFLLRGLTMSNDGVKKSKLNIQGMLCNGMRTPLGVSVKGHKTNSALGSDF